ncbi:hypothetical protein ACQ4PT_066579 [Festuca glaucescens]
MINASKSEKTLVLFVDHTNFLKGLREDVIVRPRNAPSPVERSAPSAAEASTSSTVLVAEKETMQNIQSDDSDSDDFEFYDSDFDAEDGDDDIFADNVDKSVNDNNDKELCDEHEDEDALEDDDLNLREEDRKHLKKKFTAFNPEIDMDNPSFKRGMKFSGVDELRKALTTYSIRNRVKIKKLKNDKRRIQAVCAPGYPWMLKASNDKRRTGGFVITAYEGTHKCEGSFPVKSITSKILTEKFMHEFRDNQKLDLKSFAAKVLREYKMCPERWKLSRARKDALLQIHGDEEGQFRLLMDYGQELRRSNLGSKFFLTTNSVNDPQSPDYKEHLATVYWSYDACKRGFLAGCRPFICIDGCHIKTKYKGVLLTAVGIDPNDCIYPVAFGLAEVKCTSSWEWFLTNLRDDLNISNTSPWTIMSDKQKGLINAVQKVFPDAEHRFCVRHIIQNFQRAGHRGETLKNDIWAIARSTSVPKWHRSMEKLKVDSETAYAWIEELAPNTWVKAFFSDFPKCDMLLNNHSEVFNRYLIVIDDVWREQDWKLVKTAFPQNHNGSRIIATTRITNIAKSCCSISGDQLYEMAPLSDVDSRRLLYKRIFFSDNTCPPQLEMVSATILKKCGGLPLAIITIASFLANKPQTKDEWERLQESIGSYSTHENDDSFKVMRDILLLSYWDLPQRLKTCLL